MMVTAIRLCVCVALLPLVWAGVKCGGAARRIAMAVPLGRWSVFVIDRVLGAANDKLASSRPCHSPHRQYLRSSAVSPLASGQPTQTYKPVIGEVDDCRLAGGWGGQKSGLWPLRRLCRKHQPDNGRKHLSASHCESVGLGHGFAMDKEAENTKDGLVP